MTSEVQHILAGYASAGAALREQFFATSGEKLDKAAQTLARRLRDGGKILLCGNGGSAADAQHVAAEFVNRFLLERRPLPALALTTDSSVLTSAGNDRGFAEIFALQVRALGRKGDVLVAFSTSGTSPNVLAALTAARDAGLFRLGLTGESGGDMPSLCDITLQVPHTLTPLIQEIHIAAGHMLCRLVDYYLFENTAALSAQE